MSEEEVAKFEQEVFQAELEEVNRRRAELARQANIDPEPALSSQSPSVDLGLVGMSLSGGGIRSATFCLGVIQWLAERECIRSVDYLSTVSGGGFIGSCLSSVLNSPQASLQSERFPLRSLCGQRESAGLTHLRNSGKYLAPGGLLDKARLPTLLLRGILINLWLILPAIILVGLLTELVYEYTFEYGAFLFLDMDIFTEGGRLLTTIALLLFIALTLVFPLYARLRSRSLGWSSRNRYELLLTLSLLTTLGCAALLLIILLVSAAVNHSWSELWAWLAPPKRFELDDYWRWIAVLGVIGLFMFAGNASATFSNWSSKLALYSIGIVGPTFLFLLYLLLCVWQIDSPLVGERLSLSIAPSQLQLALEEKRLPVKLREAFDPSSKRSAEQVTVARVKLRIDPTSKNSVEQLSVAGKEDWLICNPSQAFLISVDGQRVYAMETARLPKGCGDADMKFYITSHDRVVVQPFRADIYDHGGALLYAAGALLFLLNWVFININLTSAHGFYRDRLSKAYLFEELAGSGIRSNDGQKLSELNAEHSVAPYHLINAALNLQGSKDENLRGRNADFFLFSKRYSGSPRTGFVPTKELERLDSHLNLGSVCAISAAAAAPNMGSLTVNALVPLLTLLNIRLGYWLPNPRSIPGASWLTRQLLRRGAGPGYLLREAVGRLDVNRSLINVSDGGHIENLGIYELLRRKCKYIIAVDAEADPGMTFGGLLNLMRYARIDLGVEIEIDLGDLNLDGDGYSRRHGAVGKIRYADNEVGILLYIKASMTGDEFYVSDYRAHSHEFPHESTADQFFTETQFEVYRWLGHHAARQVWSGVTMADFGELGESCGDGEEQSHTIPRSPDYTVRGQV